MPRLKRLGPLVPGLVAAVLALTAPMDAAPAQENVNPGINETYLDPDLDVERFIDNFEGESREVYAARHDVVEALNLEEGDRVADIGAGTGFYTHLFADAVGETGTVYAVDLAANFLRHINETAAEAEKTNIVAVLGRRERLTLPDGAIDVAFTSNVYHHFEYPHAMLTSIRDALADGGQLIVIDFERIPGETSDFVMDHVRAGKDTVIAEAEKAGFTLAEDVMIPELEQNYMLRFRKE